LSFRSEAIHFNELGSDPDLDLSIFFILLTIYRPDLKLSFFASLFQIARNGIQWVRCWKPTFLQLSSERKDI